MILTDGKPEVDDDTGLVSYEDSRAIKCRSIVTKFRKSSSANLEVSHRWPFWIFTSLFLPSAMFIFLCRDA
jgi:hypothetical protein